VKVVFQYIQMINISGPKKRIFKEIKHADMMDFDYGEQVRFIIRVTVC